VKIIDGGEGNEGYDVYLLDTPGVFIPYVPDAEAMLKLALCGCVKDSIVAPYTLADYLLYRLNLVDPGIYAYLCPPTNEVEVLLKAIAKRSGRPSKPTEINWDALSLMMIQRWRGGRFGRFSLDSLDEESVAKYREHREEQTGSSLSQARKAEKEALRQRSRARKKAVHENG
jgi:mitochondrial GTPase 1